MIQPKLVIRYESFDNTHYVYARDPGGGEAAIGWGKTREDARRMARRTLERWAKGAALRLLEDK